MSCPPEDVSAHGDEAAHSPCRRAETLQSANEQCVALARLVNDDLARAALQG